MAKSEKAYINREVLIWARNTAHLRMDEAAQKLSVKPERLRAWEEGAEYPSIKQLIHLAEIYRRPFGVFYLAEPPKDFDTKLRDFRKLRASSGEATQSSKLTFQIRRALHRRQIAIELYREFERVEPPSFSVKAAIDSDPELVGANIRKALGIEYSAQVAWETTGEALRNWRTALEQSGVLVFQASRIELDEMRGFSISEKPFPVVVVNSKDSEGARIFTILHELAHIALNDGGICDMHEEGTSHKRHIEAFCNRVAAATLIPKESLLSELTVVDKPGRQEWTDDDLKSLARRYSVSREAVLLRLLGLQRTTQAFYERKREQFAEEYAHFRAKQEESEGGPAFHRQALAREGRFFTRLVLNNYQAENITASDVADYLDIKLKHLSVLSSEVYGGSI